MRSFYAAVPVLALVACMPAATPGPSEPRANELENYSNGSSTTFVMEGYRAWGPTAELERFDGAYRGTFNGKIVDLHMVEDRVFGTIGASKVDLHVSGDGSRVHGQGLLNGYLSSFDVDDETIAGTFGSCGYEMKRQKPDSPRYVGTQSCSGALYPTSHVTIPEFFRSLSALDQATLYTILLVG